MSLLICFDKAAINLEMKTKLSTWFWYQLFIRYQILGRMKHETHTRSFVVSCCIIFIHWQANKVFHNWGTLDCTIQLAVKLLLLFTPFFNLKHDYHMSKSQGTKAMKQTELDQIFNLWRIGFNWRGGGWGGGGGDTVDYRMVCCWSNLAVSNTLLSIR